MKGIVQDGVGKAHLPDAGVDDIQPQIVDDHVGGDVVRADDHHGSGVLDLQARAHPQCPQHPRTIHEVLRLVGDLFLEAGFATAGLQIQGREDVRLDGGSRLELLVGPDLHRVAVQVVHKDAHLPLIGVKLRRNALFQRHVFIHIGISLFFSTRRCHVLSKPRRTFQYTAVQRESPLSQRFSSKNRRALR